MNNVDFARRELLKFQYVRFTVCDINGVSRGKCIPVRNANDLDKGVQAVNCVLVLGQHNELCIPTGNIQMDYGNIAMIPDLDTLHPVPWAGGDKFKVCEFYCETAWLPSLKYQEVCPRYIAKRQWEKLQDLGFESFSGFEIEFILKYLYNKALVFDGRDYCLNKTFRRVEPFLLELESQLFESGVDISDLHLEYCPGMIECALKPQWGLQSPDSAFGFRQGLSEMVEKHGLLSSFAAISIGEDFTVGAHCNVSLWSRDRKTNLFYDATKPDSLSDVARYWIGGLVKHAGALTALCSPTVNCYRRLFLPRTPNKAVWDIDDRRTTFRVINNDMKNTYIENRIPSGKSNPYLVYAATLAAGIDGVVNKIKCPPRNDPSASNLPSSLAAALESLKQDDVMVSALSQHFVDWFVQLKTGTEIEPLRGEKAPKDDAERLKLEIAMYE